MRCALQLRPAYEHRAGQALCQKSTVQRKAGGCLHASACSSSTVTAASRLRRASRQRLVIRQVSMNSLIDKVAGAGLDALAAVGTVSAQMTQLATATTTTAMAGGLLIAAVIYAFWDAKRLSGTPKLSFQNTKFNDAVLSRMPSLRALYKPLPFLTFTHGHVETIFAAKCRKKIPLDYRRETLHMPDGGIVTLDWRVPQEGDKPLPDDAPVLILLPGLTGGSDDSYVKYAVHYAEAHGTRAVVFNSRGCGDTFITTPRYYSALYIGDMQRVVAAVRLRFPRSRLFAAGWSLGANILTNYLGLVGDETPLDAAAAMCNPFDLHLGSQNLAKGFNRVYSANLGSGMSKLMKRNLKIWNGAGGDFKVDIACNAKTVREWDDAITRVSFGFKTVDDYYKAASSYKRVSGVAIPLLVIQAEDDPIAPFEGCPTQALHDNPNCILAVTKKGGHLGWCTRGGGYRGEPWTDRVIIEWLMSVQVQLGHDGAASLAGRGSARAAGMAASEPGTPKFPSVPESLSLAAHSDDAGSSHVPNGGSLSASRMERVLYPTLYDRQYAGLPEQQFDGVTLSPSQTGYFSERDYALHSQQSLQRSVGGRGNGSVPAHMLAPSAASGASPLAASQTPQMDPPCSITKTVPLLTTAAQQNGGGAQSTIDGPRAAWSALQQQSDVVPNGQENGNAAPRTVLEDGRLLYVFDSDSDVQAADASAAAAVGQSPAGGELVQPSKAADRQAEQGPARVVVSSSARERRGAADASPARSAASSSWHDASPEQLAAAAAALTRLWESQGPGGGQLQGAAAPSAEAGRSAGTGQVPAGRMGSASQQVETVNAHFGGDALRDSGEVAEGPAAGGGAQEAVACGDLDQELAQLSEAALNAGGFMHAVETTPVGAVRSVVRSAAAHRMSAGSTATSDTQRSMWWSN